MHDCDGRGPMRYVVYGAGAIGGVLGARLHQSGREVHLVARGAHYEAIRAHGLELVAPGERTRLAIPVADRIGAVPLDPGDLVLLAMKSQDTEAALQELAAAAPEGIAVACVQNGVANERAALRLFPNVYAVLVLAPGSHSEPGVVETDAAPASGIFDLGRYPAGVDGAAERLADALCSSTYLSDARPDIMAWKYAKLLGNLANGVGALAGNDATGSELVEAVRSEGERVLGAAGIPFVTREEFRARALQLERQPVPRLGNSTVQSLFRRTAQVETDYLNGEIVLLAREHGLEAPLNGHIQRLMRHAVAERRGPGSMRYEELAAVLSATAS